MASSVQGPTAPQNNTEIGNAADRAPSVWSNVASEAGGFAIGGSVGPPGEDRARGRSGGGGDDDEVLRAHGGQTPYPMMCGTGAQAELWVRLRQVEGEKETFKRHALELTRSNELMGNEVKELQSQMAAMALALQELSGGGDWNSSMRGAAGEGRPRPSTTTSTAAARDQDGAGGQAGVRE